MKIRTLLVATAAGMLAAGTFLPIAAAGITTASLEVTAGSLSISVPVAAGSLGSRPNSVLGGTISGQLGEVQVSDARGSVAGSGWIATAISSAFTPPGPGTAIAASAVGYAAGPIVKVGTATYTANDRSDLTAVGAVVTATGITGDNSATWNPTITITVPGGAFVGIYTALITHSVA